MNKILTMPSLWAILPGEIDKIQHAYMAYLKGENPLTLPSPSAKVAAAARGEGKPGAGLFDIDIDKIPQTFFMDGDIAVMQIEGIITPKADLWSLIFGGSTIDVMTRDFTALVNDDSVKAIVMDEDSPGGVAFLIEQFANLVFEARKVKPIYSITSTMMASAAMWIGAAAEKVFITGEVVMTGSIGVVINHIDISELEKMFGIKTTEITAGKFKRIASSFKPLSEEGRTELQGQVNHVNRAFVADIARFRGTDVETVTGKMADGRTFLGSQGIEAGLIDGIISAEELIERINISISNNFNGGKGMVTIAKKKAQEVMTAEAIQEDNPVVYTEIFNLGAREARDELNAAVAESFEKGREQGKGEGEIIGAKNEMSRILAVEAQLVPGHEKLIARLKADGLTTGPQAAVEVIKADKELRAKGLKTFKAEAEDPVDNEVETEETGGKDKKDFKMLVAEYKEEHKCGVTEAMKVIAKSHPEEHKKYKAG